jgi:hypothetical protein
VHDCIFEGCVFASEFADLVEEIFELFVFGLDTALKLSNDDFSAIVAERFFFFTHSLLCFRELD